MVQTAGADESAPYKRRVGIYADQANDGMQT
jgi:hypothetical protein